MGPPGGHHTEGHFGPALLGLFSSTLTLLASIPRRGNRPEGQDRLLRLLGPRRPHFFRGGVWRLPPHLLPLCLVGALALLTAQGGGDLGLDDPGVNCTPLFMAFRGASSTEAALCFRLERRKRESEEREKQKIKRKTKMLKHTLLVGQPSSGSLELPGASRST